MRMFYFMYEHLSFFLGRVILLSLIYKRCDIYPTSWKTIEYNDQTERQGDLDCTSCIMFTGFLQLLIFAKASMVSQT
jgi:hypothetical protein